MMLRRPDHLEPGRQELLLRMYDQMWSNINRHILVVWQSVGVLVAAFALYAAVGERLISLDVATALVVLTATWLAANVYDASAWYNRNQAIIVNIERLFLTPADLRYVHPYFAEHRAPGHVLRHLRLQLYLGYGICAVALLYHASERVIPTFSLRAHVSCAKLLPYLAALFALGFVRHFRDRAKADAREFSCKAPGVRLAADPPAKVPGKGSEPA